jgi:hypothetical protein
MSDDRDASDREAPVTLIEDADTGDRFLVYQGKNGIGVELKVEGESFWATQAQMALMFGVTKQSVSRHLKKIFEEGELAELSVVKQVLTTALDGKRYLTSLYDLNALIAVGYRINSKLGTMFRIWATQTLFQYLTKGFVIDDARLKNPDGRPDFFEELLQRIRDIRSSEKRMWTRILELASFCSDYDAKDPAQHTEFFAEIQNTMHWAVLQMTAPELVMDRVNAKNDNAGVITFKGKLPTVDEAQTAKNLLLEPEIVALNHITSLTLEFFDSQAEQRRPTTLSQFVSKMRDLVKLDGRPLKQAGYAGKVTRLRANQWASDQIHRFKEKKRIEAEASGEQSLRRIIQAVKAKPKPERRPRKSK